MANQPDFTAAIISLVDAARWPITFADLMALPGSRGDASLMLGRNLVIWTGLADPLAEALKTLRATGVVQFTPADALSYVATGIVPTLPVARSADAILTGRYSTPHWVPLAIKRGPAWGTRSPLDSGAVS